MNTDEAISRKRTMPFHGNRISHGFTALAAPPNELIKVNSFENPSRLYRLVNAYPPPL